MTFSGLLSKVLKQNAAANSAAAAGATKPGAVASATTTTSTGTTHLQGTVMVPPKTDSAPAPASDPVLSIMTSSPSLPPQQQQPTQPTSIDPAVLSVDPRSPSPAQQQPTITNLDMKQPTPLSPPSTTPSSPSAAGSTTAAAKKKKQQQQQQVLQNLSAAQSASYRKRLNVNQVCDWCRYRKIRCDREAPCNSCQHSKRECIRTPPEVLLSKLNNKDAEDSSTTTTESTPATSKATKRSSPADEQDDQISSLRTKKAALSNSIAPSSSSFHINVDHKNNSNNHTASTTLSPAMSGSLSLSPPSTMGLSPCGEQPQQPMTILSSGIQGTPSSLQDQEHLERMRRIEMLLSNVIPGAAEFIAHGHHHNHQRSNSFSAALSSEQHGQQQNIISPVSPALTATGSPLGLTPIQDDSYIERMKRIELLLGSVQDNNNCNNNALVTKLSLTVPPSSTGADTTGSKSSSNDDAKKESTPTTTTRKNKVAGTKKGARNSDGTIIKRPHVAAGFAGQKPPPKLPQAIAEAALKKLTGKKKKKRAASASSAASSASAAATTATVAVTPVATAVSAASTASTAPVAAVMVEGAPVSPVSITTTATPPIQSSGVLQPKVEVPAAVMLSSPKSFDIPANIENQHHHQIQENTLLSFTQQQLQQQKQRQQQQHPRPGRLNTQLRTSASYRPHHQHHQRHTPSPPSYLGGGGHMTNIGSISIPTIPISNTMASYESLVVPACNSADSSPASSPRISTTTIEFPTIGGSNGSSVSVCGPNGSTSPLTPMDFLVYGATSSHHSSFGPTMMHNGSVGGDAGADFSLALDMIHPGTASTTDQQRVSPIHDGANNQVLLPFTTHGTAAAALLYSPHFLQQQAMHIPQDAMPPTSTPTSLGVQDFTNGAALQMTESLESWMNSQLVPSLNVFSNNNNNSNTALLTHTNSPFLTGTAFGQPQPQQMQPQQQYQQGFYIPQMPDDEEDDEGVDEVLHE